jgi:hypothetical protein
VTATSHPARCGFDQDRFVRPHPGEFGERERRAPVRQQRDRIVQGDFARHFEQPRGLGDGPRRVSPGAVERGDDLSADEAAIDPVAGLGDRAADSVAQDRRQREKHPGTRRPARPDLRLDERDPGELDVDSYLPRAGHRRGHLGGFQDTRRAEPPHDHRAHGAASLLPDPIRSITLRITIVWHRDVPLAEPGFRTRPAGRGAA